MLTIDVFRVRLSGISGQTFLIFSLHARFVWWLKSCVVLYAARGPLHTRIVATNPLIISYSWLSLWMCMANDQTNEPKQSCAKTTRGEKKMEETLNRFQPLFFLVVCHFLKSLLIFRCSRRRCLSCVFCVCAVHILYFWYKLNVNVCFNVDNFYSLIVLLLPMPTHFFLFLCVAVWTSLHNIERINVLWPNGCGEVFAPHVASLPNTTTANIICSNNISLVAIQRFRAVDGIFFWFICSFNLTSTFPVGDIQF